MAIFISHSHKDSAFVDMLAKRLVQQKHHVWVDRWELSIGDSLIDKIQGVLQQANAVLVIISKHSIESQWCKRELYASLTREQGEGKTIVMPCVIDDCEVPLFLKDKLYADFHQNPDKAWSDLNRSLARFSTPYQNRIETPNFVTDWAMDWALEPSLSFRFTFVDHNHDWPYVVITEFKVIPLDNEAKSELRGALDESEAYQLAHRILHPIASVLNEVPENVTITNHMPVEIVRHLEHPDYGRVALALSYRRLGEENDMDTMIYVHNNLSMIYSQITAFIRD